ncbi:hypothetical protein Hypma_005175 [Hypsizygus marmoreus]|uniref:Uncharacterized protein n=1 Tax=Hypsizygus marmoreus TaxID=39966 RepID=A0A369J6N1_HYPMA|nr:hypothetical protein Hypma_005175 [Hypsizygus marmoreus]
MQENVNEGRSATGPRAHKTKLDIDIVRPSFESELLRAHSPCLPRLVDCWMRSAMSKRVWWWWTKSLLSTQPKLRLDPDTPTLSLFPRPFGIDLCLVIARSILRRWCV